MDGSPSKYYTMGNNSLLNNKLVRLSEPNLFNHTCMLVVLASLLLVVGDEVDVSITVES
jgi:hypothetical protein